MEIKYEWEDCTIGFICPECGTELVGNSQDSEEECECGLKYQLGSHLVINGTEVTKYTRI